MQHSNKRPESTPSGWRGTKPKAIRVGIAARHPFSVMLKSMWKKFVLRVGQINRRRRLLMKCFTLGMRPGFTRIKDIGVRLTARRRYTALRWLGEVTEYGTLAGSSDVSSASYEYPGNFYFAEDWSPKHEAVKGLAKQAEVLFKIGYHYSELQVCHYRDTKKRQVLPKSWGN